LVVSDVFQKAVVDVDENGSEAAAVTTIMVNLTSARIEPEPVVTVNRPFYYMIADIDAGRVLFAGRIMNL
jgi:serpin B